MALTDVAVRKARPKAKAYWKGRVKMMQWWSDYLDQLREGAKVVPIKPPKR